MYEEVRGLSQCMRKSETMAVYEKVRGISQCMRKSEVYVSV